MTSPGATNALPRDLRPTETVAFAGALRYTSYGFLKRQLMKQITKDKGLSTDTPHRHVYTDWAAVKSFSRRAAALTSPPG